MWLLSLGWNVIRRWQVVIWNKINWEILHSDLNRRWNEKYDLISWRCRKINFLLICYGKENFSVLLWCYHLLARITCGSRSRLNLELHLSICNKMLWRRYRLVYDSIYDFFLDCWWCSLFLLPSEKVHQRRQTNILLSRSCRYCSLCSCFCCIYYLMLLLRSN